MSATRIIGLGQPFAGDDAVGLAVIAHLRAQPTSGIELCECLDATELVDVVGGAASVILVDGVVGLPPGRVQALGLDALDRARRATASSHGLGADQAIALAEALSPPANARFVRLVGIGIVAAARGVQRLSPAVARAVPEAAALAVTLAQLTASQCE